MDDKQIDKDIQRRFMCDQVHEIEIHKWIVSEKAGCDQGQRACIEWIRQHAKEFRSFWFSAHDC